MHPPTSHSARGVVSSLAASVLFGGMFLVSGLLDASAEAVWAWRVIVTAACFGAALAWPASRRALAALWATLRRRRWMPIVLLVTGAILGVQMWLFAWTPMNGHGLDAALGYLLLPLILVLSGRFLFHEHVSRTQWWAMAIAVVAVGVKIVFSTSISWVTVVVCVGYAVYFALRKRYGLETQAAFAGEIAVMCVVAAPLLFFVRGADSPAQQALVLLAGLAGAAALSMYLSASELLTMPVFGLLSYVEPVLMFVAALLLGEHLAPPDVVTYGLLAIALAVLAAGSLRGGRASSR